MEYQKLSHSPRKSRNKRQNKYKQIRQIENIYQDGTFRFNHKCQYLYVNQINNPLKRQKLSDWIEKRDLEHAISKKNTFFKYKTRQVWRDKPGLWTGDSINLLS